jgi:hypothetical protein
MCATKTKREVCKNEPNNFSSIKNSRVWRESSIHDKIYFSVTDRIGNLSYVPIASMITVDRQRKHGKRASIKAKNKSQGNKQAEGSDELYFLSIESNVPLAASF